MASLGVSAVAIAVVAGCLIGALLAYGPPLVRKSGATGIDVMLTLGEYADRGTRADSGHRPDADRRCSACRRVVERSRY